MLAILHQANYLSCSPTSDVSDIVDILGFNVYNWCSRVDTYVTSGYQNIQTQFTNSGVNVPVLFSEYGCNEVRCCLAATTCRRLLFPAPR